MSYDAPIAGEALAGDVEFTIVATTENKNPLPLPPGRTLVFVHKKDSAGFFVCSSCKKEFLTSDPAEGLHLFNSHKCAPGKKSK